MLRRIAPTALFVLGLIAMVGTASAAEEPHDSFGVVDMTTGIWYLHDAATTETTSF